MQKGYEYLAAGNEQKACELWAGVWGYLKEFYTSVAKDVDDIDKIFQGQQSVFNWCQDFELELGNAGLRDNKFHHLRIQFCTEFCELFPETDKLTLHNMMRAGAESYFGIGDRENGDKTFEKLTQTYPENAWGYIGWGGVYDGFIRYDDIPVDLEKAKRIYQMGLERATIDKEEIKSRLKVLESKKSVVAAKE